MSELKEFPTQEEYDKNPEYRNSFLRSQKEFRERIMFLVEEAGNDSNLGLLQFHFATLKHLEDKTMQFFVDMDNMPYWQVDEVNYCIDMYREMLTEIKRIYEKRRRGQ